MPMVKIASPISELFENKDYAKKIIKNSDCLECRDESVNSKLKRQEIFHCDLQPIHELTRKDYLRLKRIKKLKPDLKLITFHIASSCSMPRTVNKMFVSGGKNYSRAQLISNAKNNLAEIKNIFGSKVKIAVENNNYYPAPAYKYVTDPEFISEVVCANKINFLYDIAHGFVTAVNSKIKYEDYKKKLPLDRIVQVHICSYGIKSDDMAFDAHDCPKDREYKEVISLLKNSSVRYLTVEYYRQIDDLIASLKKLRELI